MDEGGGVDVCMREEVHEGGGVDVCMRVEV